MEIITRSPGIATKTRPAEAWYRSVGSHIFADPAPPMFLRTVDRQPRHGAWRARLPPSGSVDFAQFFGRAYPLPQIALMQIVGVR